MAIYIGTSGWMYKDWGAAFYPEGMKRGQLTFLAQEFTTVEVNSSFYHLPTKETFTKWKSEVPDDFVFAVKLSRYVTHQHKLRDVREPLENFIRNAKGLGSKLAVILVQLPPSLRYDATLLKTFLKDIAVVSSRNRFTTRWALEPRHDSWMTHAAEVLPLLRAAHIALVFPHSANIPSFAPVDENITGAFTYVRFHGPSEFAASRYGPRRLKPWALRIAEWQRTGLDVFVYFNNDVHGHAIHDARTLLRQLTPRKKKAR